MLPAGHGFGLGFAVRKERGMATTPGSAGMLLLERHGRHLLLDRPGGAMTAVFMMQGPGQREYYRNLIRNLVYAAIVD